MKIVSFINDNKPSYGIALPDENGAGGVIVPSASFLGRFPSLRSVLDGNALVDLVDDTAGQTPTLWLEDLIYLPPLHDAEKVICIGVNYPKRHPVEGDIPPPKYISTFGKFEGSIVAHNQPIQFPDAPMCETFDYEGELVLVIGKGGRNISVEDAFDHIAGYTIMNDGSVREWQKHSVPAGKNFFAASACGPWMVTADEIDDPFALKLSTRLNDEEVQSTTAGEMIFSIPVLVNYVSTFLDLKPGDLISTGSPAGSGGSRIPQRFLNKGDRLDIEWTGIGTLKTWVE